MSVEVPASSSAAQPASSTPPPARISGPVSPHKPNGLQRVAARLIYGLIRGVSLTVRYRWDGDPGKLAADGHPYIFCIWHNRLPLSIVIYRRYMVAMKRPAQMAALVSASRDGALLSRVLELLQVQPVRGSSSRRGAQALLELNSWLERGYDVAITVDGPRGPRYQVKPGVIGLAQVTGRVIVPASYSVTRKWTLKSWDRFQIPKPFATCTIRFGEPMRIDRDASDETRERSRRELERRLLELTVD
jgi:lysophospholipid acyltransferase (LPLAT)-like uncharacterized protein